MHYCISKFLKTQIFILYTQKLFPKFHTYLNILKTFLHLLIGIPNSLSVCYLAIKCIWLDIQFTSITLIFKFKFNLRHRPSTWFNILLIFIAKFSILTWNFMCKSHLLYIYFLDKSKPLNRGYRCTISQCGILHWYLQWQISNQNPPKPG